MRQITEGVYGLVMSRGIANAKPVGAGKVRGIGDGERSRESALSHQPAGREDNQPMGIKKAEAGAPAVEQGLKLNRPGWRRGGFAFVVHMNHAVPTSTRKRTQQVPFLVVVK